MKKLISCLSAIVLACGILVGCGGDSGSGSADSSTASVVTTPESVAKKAEAVQAKIIELGQSNPEKLLKVTEEMQTKLPELQSADDLEAINRFYDEMLKLME
jgi:ABC-type glycerol-3-phosphate transport system substrate-binding protein